MRRRSMCASLLALMVVAAACGGESATDSTAAEAADDATTETTEAMAEDTTTTPASETTGTVGNEVTVGTADNPIQVLFVPSVSADEIIAGGELLAETLSSETGLTFEVGVPTSYAATLEEMCAAPDRSIGFIPAQAYVLGNELCGMDIALKSERFGFDVYWAQFITQRDSDIQSLEDVAGTTWAYPDAGSTSGYLVPQGMLEQAGLEVGEEVEAGDHDAVVRAVYNEEADFGTTFFSPPTDLEGNSVWDETVGGAEVPDDVIDTCGLGGDGELVCGDDFVIRDARRNIREENPDVIQKVRIFEISDPIPNDGVAFGPDFPEDLRQQIVDAMLTFAENDPEGFATAFEGYSWDSVNTANDAEFDSIRAIVQAVGITVDDL